MPRPVPVDLEDALAANPGARERFWAMPAEQKDRWVGWVERARLPSTRRRRVAEAVRRIGARRARTRTVYGNGAGPAVVPRENWWVWVFGLALLGGLAAFLVWLTVLRNHHHARPAAAVVTARSTVPKVVGIRFQAAAFQLKQANLGMRLVKRNAKRPQGIVIGQKPGSGASVPEGTTVTLLVSMGPPRIAMPDVVGMAAADAANALQARKLVPSLQQTPSQQPPGTVLAQTPKPGARAKAGTRVVLQVAKGSASVPVPDVTGQPVSQANSMLQQAGFKVTSVQVSSNRPNGTVVAQHPAAGQNAARSSTVRLGVAKKAPQTTTAPQQTTTAPQTTTTATHQTTTTQSTTRASTVPAPIGNDYRGMRLLAAVQKIAQGRQQVIVQYVASSRPIGVVVANSTAGSRVRLQVSAGAQPKPSTSVTDVTGEDESSAKQDLASAGFSVIAVQWPVGDATQDGVVTYETPSGTEVPQSAAIVIYVGSATG